MFRLDLESICDVRVGYTDPSHSTKARHNPSHHVHRQRNSPAVDAADATDYADPVDEGCVCFGEFQSGLVCMCVCVHACVCV